MQLSTELNRQHNSIRIDDHNIDQIFSYEFTYKLFNYLEDKSQKKLSEVNKYFRKIYLVYKLSDAYYTNLHYNQDPRLNNQIKNAIIQLRDDIKTISIKYLKNLLSKDNLKQVIIINCNIYNNTLFTKRGFRYMISGELGLRNLTSFIYIDKTNELEVQYNLQKLYILSGEIGPLLNGITTLQELVIRSTSVDSVFIGHIINTRPTIVKLSNLATWSIIAIPSYLERQFENLKVLHLCYNKRTRPITFEAYSEAIFRLLPQYTRLYDLHITFVCQGRARYRNILRLPELRELTAHVGYDHFDSDIVRKLKRLSWKFQQNIEIKILPFAFTRYNISKPDIEELINLYRKGIRKHSNIVVLSTDKSETC